MRQKRIWMVVLVLVLALALVAPDSNPDQVQSLSHLTETVGVAPLTPGQAIAVAVNDLEATADGYRLRHPRHVVTFTPAGLRFTPRRGGPEWAWHLTMVMAGESPLPGVETGPVQPARQSSLSVAYHRGGVVEQYLARQVSLEQQFVIPRPLPLAGADLVVVGIVHSAGAFEATAEGWRWHTSEGAVQLGNVQVYDAAGQAIPVVMQVSDSETRLVVDGGALAQAAYPITIDPEIGANDFRLSDMGGISAAYDAQTPAVAYNSTDNQYLVVWSGDDNTPPLVDGEFEIYGQLVDAATGEEVGPNDIRLSDMGPTGNASYDALAPDVAYDPFSNQYLVVWYGDDNTGSLADNEFEIYRQRVRANGEEIDSDFRISDMGTDGSTAFNAYNPAVAFDSTHRRYLVVWYGSDSMQLAGEFEIFGQLLYYYGGEISPNDFRISDMGAMDGDPYFNAFYPDVAYNSTNDEYLVVWHGDNDILPLVSDEFEIFGQRLNAWGIEVGMNDFRISDMGPNGSTAYGAFDPAVAYDGTDNQYLVVWYGDDNTGSLADNELEIFGQLLTGNGSQPVGDFRISSVGTDGVASTDAYSPDVSYNSTYNQYMVTWRCDEPSLLADDEYEIYGQRISSAGAMIGVNLRLSDMEPDGDANYGAFSPAMAYNSAGNEYLVVWSGDDNVSGLANDELEIFGQRVSASGAEAGTNDVRLSDMGRDEYSARLPDVAYNSTDNEYLVVWAGDDNTGLLVDGEYEIFGQLVDAATGTEIGANDFRISNMGPDGNAAYDADNPRVAYNSTNNEYLVVWVGDGETNGEDEIYGQLLAAGGAQIGADFRLSDMGPEDDTNYAAKAPAVAYSSTNNEYLVVWQGDDNTDGQLWAECEVFGQRVSAAGAEIGTDFRISAQNGIGNSSGDAEAPAVAYDSTNNEYLVVWSGSVYTLEMQGFEIYGQLVSCAGVPFGPDDFRISQMGPDHSANYEAKYPAVAYNSTDNEYLAVWCGDNRTGCGGTCAGEWEIYGQRVSNVGAEIGTDFRISHMGPDGSVDYDAFLPDVAYNSTDNVYLVVWNADDDTGSLVNDEPEIFGQRVSADGTTNGTDLRLSDMGPDGSVSYSAAYSAVAYNSQANEYLVVWEGDDNTAPLVDNECEIFGQRFMGAGGGTVYLPIILKNASP